jgi:DNA-binding HxlR family transcriptional regulator
VEDLLGVIRRRYSLSVLHAIQVREPARYRDIEAAVPGASSSTLVETLHALETARLVDRSPSADGEPRFSYRLTAAGTLLIQRLRPLLSELRDR